jgi:hypothetical protein
MMSLMCNNNDSSRSRMRTDFLKFMQIDCRNCNRVAFRDHNHKNNEYQLSGASEIRYNQATEG